MKLSFVTRGDARKTTPDKVFDGDFEEFAQHFKTYTPNRNKHDGYFVRGLLTGKRSNKNLPTAEVLVLDGDQTIISADKKQYDENRAPDPKILHNALKLSFINHFIYTTHSHNPPTKRKWRCVISCGMDSQDQLKPTLNKIFEFFKSIDYPLLNVKENWTWSQPWFLPNRDLDDGKYLYLEYFKGKPYPASMASIIASTAPASGQVSATGTNGTQGSAQTPTNTHRDNLNAIRKGNSYYKELQNVLYGFAKDGRAKDAALGDIEMIMIASKASNKTHAEHDKWVERFKEIPVYVEQAYGAVMEKEDDVVDIDDIGAMEDLQSFNFELPWPPGLMGRLCKNFFAMAPHPNQEISIMGGICLVAGVIGRKYNVMGTGLNIYGTLLADSGIGKAVLKDGINLALRSANALHGQLYIGSSRFTGPKAIFDMLDGGLSRVCIMEESGLLNQSKAGDTAGLSRVMLDLYTSSGVNQWAGAEAYSDKGNNIKAIQAPALTLLNVSTPKSYLEAMKDKGAQLSGEIARMWMIRTLRDKPYLNTNRKKTFEPSIIEKLSQLTTFCFDRQTSDSMGAVINLKASGEHLQQTSNEFVDLENKFRNNDDHLRRTLCSRAFMKIMKLAGICSVFNGKDSIGKKEFDWAKATVKKEMDFIQNTFTYESTDDLLSVVKTIVGVSILKALKGDYKGKTKAISDKLKKRGGITKYTLTQILSKNLVVKELDDDPTRANPRTGLEKCIEYMLRGGLLIKMEEPEMKVFAPRAKIVYKITHDFKLMMTDDEDDD